MYTMNLGAWGRREVSLEYNQKGYRLGRMKTQKFVNFLVVLRENRI